MSNNPLQNYFRSPKIYITLPSKGEYYDESIIEFKNDEKEIGVLALTAKDELMFKNPEAILNGEATYNALLSCVPGLKQPKKLLMNDVQALFVAIKHATFGDELDLVEKCEKCEHENKFTLTPENTLETMTYLDDMYVVNLDNGLSIFMSPVSLETSGKALKLTLEQTRILRTFDDPNISEDEKVKMFNQSFMNISMINHEVLADSIIKIVKEEDGICVTDHDNILEFIKNTEKENFDKIHDMAQEIGQIGVKSKFDVSCINCKHEWNLEIDFDPRTFFTKS